MSTPNAERLKILEMLEQGKISAEEAASLLRALEGSQRAASSIPAKVNVILPLSLVGAGLRMAERFAPEFEGFDLQELEELLATGADGKIVEVMDEQDNERVEIFVE
jgi:DNA-binding transcriptional ArsR family regulator